MFSCTFRCTTPVDSRRAFLKLRIVLLLQVVVQAGEPPELVSNVTLSTLSEDSALQLLLSNLSHHSAYHVSVAAATTAGLGPFSAPFTVRPTVPLGQHHRYVEMVEIRMSP